MAEVHKIPEVIIAEPGSMKIKTGVWRTVKVEIDEKKCTSCMICYLFCPDLAIRIVEGKPRLDLDYCKGCGICEVECPEDAVIITPIYEVP